jgi:hypothetical protein
MLSVRKKNEDLRFLKNRIPYPFDGVCFLHDVVVILHTTFFEEVAFWNGTVSDKDFPLHSSPLSLPFLKIQYMHQYKNFVPNVSICYTVIAIVKELMNREV